MQRVLVCRELDLPESEGRGFRAAGVELVLVRRGADIFAYENRCPHRGTSLDWAPDRFMSDDGRLLQCATHGAFFRLEDGDCVSGPCFGERLRPLAIERSGGDVWLVT